MATILLRGCRGSQSQATLSPDTVLPRKAMQRRLAAILAADVVGYSRLMGADEMGTITSLKSHRRELVDSGIAEHRGRIVKTTGDGMLVCDARRRTGASAFPRGTEGFYRAEGRALT